MTHTAQITLAANQIEAFYHDQFVESQVRRYSQMVPEHVKSPRAVVDIGGGCGFFAQRLMEANGQAVRVIDMDPSSVQACLDKGVEAKLGDALAPECRGDEDVVCFNLILHHLVGANESLTHDMQSHALAYWRGKAQAVFVDEYIYDSYFFNIAGRLIYAITSSRLLSTMAKAISHFIPSLRANTFGVGVRFRAHDEWCSFFDSLGYCVVASVRGPEEHVSVARRLLCIRSCRRDSFLLMRIDRAIASKF